MEGLILMDEDVKPRRVGPTKPNILNSSGTVIRVKGGTNVRKLANSIEHSLENYRRLELSTVGAGAISQAVKAVAVAAGWQRQKGYDLVCRPVMRDEPMEIEGATSEQVTKVILSLERYKI